MSSFDDTERISDGEVGDIPNGESTSMALECDGRVSPVRTAVKLRARCRQLMSRPLFDWSASLGRLLRKGVDEAKDPLMVAAFSSGCTTREGLLAVLCFEPMAGGQVAKEIGLQVVVHRQRSHVTTQGPGSPHLRKLIVEHQVEHEF